MSLWEQNFLFHILHQPFGYGSNGAVQGNRPWVIAISFFDRGYVERVSVLDILGSFFLGNLNFSLGICGLQRGKGGRRSPWFDNTIFGYFLSPFGIWLLVRRSGGKEEAFNSVPPQQCKYNPLSASKFADCAKSEAIWTSFISSAGLTVSEGSRTRPEKNEKTEALRLFGWYRKETHYLKSLEATFWNRCKALKTVTKPHKDVQYQYKAFMIHR